MLGLLGIVVFHARTLSHHVKENLGFTIYYHANAREAEILKAQKMLDTAVFVRSTRYVSAEEAAEMLKEELGEDFVGFLGYNPLTPSLEVKLKSVYSTPDSVRRIEESLLKNPLVAQIESQKDFIGKVNDNIRKIGLLLAGFSLLLLLVSIGLINNTVRLAVYSKRFIIRSMMLVGATRGFIRRPFVWQGMFQGFISALLASAVLTLLLYSLHSQIPEMLAMGNWQTITLVYGILALTGALITGLSNHLAVTRYLNMKIDNLYL